jgi:hypothetical protein
MADGNSGTYRLSTYGSDWPELSGKTTIEANELAALIRNMGSN